MAKILEKRPLTAITKLYRVDAPLVAKAAKPGQFVIVRVREGGERIPLTIADYDRDGYEPRNLATTDVGDQIWKAGQHVALG